MLGRIRPTSSLNSFSSICYCLTALGLHSFCVYQAIRRYQESVTRVWPGSSGVPSEATLLLGATVVTLVMLPFFCVTCFFKIGNLANDGVKLGRDHALGCLVNTPLPGNDSRGETWRGIWRHFCPISQTLHLLAAFLLLIPETLLTAVEVKFGYKSPDASWSSNLDFLYSPYRSLLSEARSSYNSSSHLNSTHLTPITLHLPSTMRYDATASVSIAFINFCYAFAAFVTRYASVFWYTNKPLTAILAIQLLAMAVSSVLSLSCFSVLYCVCYNRKMYPNVSLSFNCALTVFLYLSGSTILLLSSMVVFQYGCHYFQEKFQIVARHHESDSYVKETIPTIGEASCRIYVPHLCAMAALTLLAACKGPFLYDLMTLVRLTDDYLLLSGIVGEVCYMVMWVALWFGLTIKQQWQFRVLDFVPLNQQLDSVQNSCLVKDPTHEFVITGEDTRAYGSEIGKEQLPKYANPNPVMTLPFQDQQYYSDIEIAEPDMVYNTITDATVAGHDLNNPIEDSEDYPSWRKSRYRRQARQRVTFDESIHDHDSVDKESRLWTNGALPIRESDPAFGVDTNHFNIRADVHNSTASSTNSSNESAQDLANAELAYRIPGHEPGLYRQNLRNKCSEFYSKDNILSSNFQEKPSVTVPGEHQPTLMASFRDKVRESLYRVTEKQGPHHFTYTDPLPPPVTEDWPNPQVGREFSPAEGRYARVNSSHVPRNVIGGSRRPASGEYPFRCDDNFSNYIRKFHIKSLSLPSSNQRSWPLADNSSSLDGCLSSFTDDRRTTSNQTRPSPLPTDDR